MNWEMTYSSDFSLSLEESNTSASSYHPLECQLMIDYLKIGRNINDAPYLTWNDTFESCESIYKSFGDLKKIIDIRPDLEESLHAYLKNNRLTYILDKVILGSLQLLEMTSNLFIFNKFHNMSLLVEYVFEFAQLYAIQINDQIIVNLIAVLESYRHLENQYFTNIQLQILEKKPRGVNKIILVILSYTYPTLTLFKFLQQQLINEEGDNRRISQLLKDYSVLLENLRMKVDHDYDEVIELEEIKYQIETMIAYILRSSYHRYNWYIFQQIQTDFKELFPDSYFNDDTRFITPAFNSDLEPNQEHVAPWLRDFFETPPEEVVQQKQQQENEENDKVIEQSTLLNAKLIVDESPRVHKVSPILNKFKSKLSRIFVRHHHR